jgi:hypothetical protein
MTTAETAAETTDEQIDRARAGSAYRARSCAPRMQVLPDSLDQVPSICGNGPVFAYHWHMIMEIGQKGAD